MSTPRRQHCADMPDIADILGHSDLAQDIMNHVHYEGVTTLNQPASLNDRELLDIRGIGEISAQFIRQRLERHHSRRGH
jgi:hypothetical protein